MVGHPSVCHALHRDGRIFIQKWRRTQRVGSSDFLAIHLVDEGDKLAGEIAKFCFGFFENQIDGILGDGDHLFDFQGGVPYICLLLLLLFEKSERHISCLSGRKVNGQGLQIAPMVYFCSLMTCS